MNHFRARRLLAGLPDGTLAPAREAEVRAHLAGCRRCRRHLRELEACETLLGELPTSLLPLEASRDAESRLGSLARWAPVPTTSPAERLGISALGAVTAAAMLALVLTQTGLGPTPTPGPQEVALAQVLPDSQLMPTGVRR